MKLEFTGSIDWYRPSPTGSERRRFAPRMANAPRPRTLTVRGPARMVARAIANTLAEERAWFLDGLVAVVDYGVAPDLVYDVAGLALPGFEYEEPPPWVGRPEQRPDAGYLFLVSGWWTERGERNAELTEKWEYDPRNARGVGEMLEDLTREEVAWMVGSALRLELLLADRDWDHPDDEVYREIDMYADLTSFEPSRKAWRPGRRGRG